MLLIANIVSQGENKVETLNNLKKTQILKRLEEYLKDKPTGNPNVAIALACELTLPFEEDDLTAKDYITLGEWLAEKNIELSLGDKQRLANLVADKYLAEYGKKPKVVARKNEQGYFRNKANGFHPSQIWILDEALQELQHKDVIRKPVDEEPDHQNG
ncbi:hypothetical protein [Coleofasciculus sp. FACHB-SPT36]|uniref:hypothetical protein n=1 Tax=Cyanophyceae TaxID=3028117 RepID=UPI00168A8D8A|nr:hypothetical protein [Coleofasciculus sp. FACHB-SPT36]MBD2537522.1 hypothetical protein [Coleofasciculus sp. FACHB-SPT36]